VSQAFRAPLNTHIAVSQLILTSKNSVFFNKVINYFKGDVKATTALWGLSFKLKPMTCVKPFIIHSKKTLEAGAIVRDMIQLLLTKLNIK
jgi:hypothetical protein